MQIGNWTTVDAASVGGGGSQLEPGGYVVVIQKAEDHPADGYVDLTIDIIEGENAFMYSGLPESDDWRHTYRRYYEGGAAPFFKQFLDALEISNRGRFSIEAWERKNMGPDGEAQYGWEDDFVNLELGVIFQKRLFTKKSGKNAGKDGWNLNWFASVPAQDIRNGDFTVPADKDEREAAVAKPATGVYDDVDV